MLLEGPRFNDEAPSFYSSLAGWQFSIAVSSIPRPLFRPFVINAVVPRRGFLAVLHGVSRGDKKFDIVGYADG